MRTRSAACTWPRLIVVTNKPNKIRFMIFPFEGAFIDPSGANIHYCENSSRLAGSAIVFMRDIGNVLSWEGAMGTANGFFKSNLFAELQKASCPALLQIAVRLQKPIHRYPAFSIASHAAVAL